MLEIIHRNTRNCIVTHCCVTLHVHADLFDFLWSDTGKDGRVCSFTEKQCITCTQSSTDLVSAEGQY